MLIDYYQLLKYDQVNIEQAEQPADEQDEEMKDAKIDNKNSNSLE